MRRTIVIFMLIVAPAVVAAQSSLLPLATDSNGTGLYANLDYVWNYNLYELSRWGLGLNYKIVHSRTAETMLAGYAGYGVKDRQWKGGLGVTHRWNGNVLYFNAKRDYSAAASRRMNAVSLLDINDLSVFMASRMSDNRSLVAGYLRGWGYNSVSIDAHLFFGGRLFGGSGLRYLCDGDSISPENGLEATLSYRYHNSLKTLLIVGKIWPTDKAILKLLTEYQKTLGFKHTYLSCFLQGGITPPNTPYIRMFDLGGTYGAPLCFRNALLTVRPNEYTANVFAFISLRFGLNKPLFRFYNKVFAIGSNPKPFVGMNGAWGWLWGQDEYGVLNYETLWLEALYNGYLEALVGVDGLLRWGGVDYGLSFAAGRPLSSDGQLRTSVLVNAVISL